MGNVRAGRDSSLCPRVTATVMPSPSDDILSERDDEKTLQTSSHSIETKQWGGVWLSGVSGSGKSTLGKVLADRLGYELVDSDDVAFSHLLSDTPRSTADDMSSSLPASPPRVWASLSFPGRGTYLKVGLACTALLAMRRKTSSYSAWLTGGRPGRALDTWIGLSEADLIVDASLPTTFLADLVTKHLHDAHLLP
jgi:hypothetical protein